VWTSSKISSLPPARQVTGAVQARRHRTLSSKQSSRQLAALKVFGSTHPRTAAIAPRALRSREVAAAAAAAAAAVAATTTAAPQMTHSLGRDEDGPGGAGEPGSESRSGGKQCVPEHQAQALHSKSSLASFELELASAMAKPSKPSQVKFQLVLIRRPTLSHRLKAMRTRLMCRPFGAQHLNRTSTRIVPTSLAPNILLASSRCSSKSNDQISFASAEARGSCKRVAPAIARGHISSLRFAAT